MRKAIFLLFFLSGFYNAKSQKLWNLQECIERASISNLSVIDQRLNSKLSDYAKIQSQLALIPSLNLYSSQVHNFGRAIDPLTNDFTIENVRSNNFSLVSSVTLFSGFQKLNLIKKKKIDSQEGLVNIERTINDISISVANSFLQVLFAKELLQISKEQLQVSVLQVSRIKKMVEYGALAVGNLLEVESQMYAEELQLINSQNELEAAYLNIKQLLEINDNIDFEIKVPQILIPDSINLPSTDHIYSFALTFFPQIKSASLKLSSSKKDLLIAKGARSPSILLNSSIGTGFSDARFDILTGLKTPFDIQIEDNFSQSITLSLNIPIYNEWQVNNSVQQAKIGVMKYENLLAQEKNQLRKEIEQARANVLAAEKQFSFAKKSAESFRESFRYFEQKYNLGIIDTYEYNDAKIKLNKAESELVRAKYDFVFKLKIIDFYMGKKLTL
tara:strand:- start:64 stop:1395 length:1332 start_codon:yes stop_codon:yes gene_type:complete